MLQIEELYKKYLEDSISESDRKELFRLLRTTGDERLGQLADTFLKAEAPADLDYLQGDTDRIFLEIRSQIEEPVEAGSRSWGMWRWMAAAAACFLLLGIGIWIYYSRTPLDLSSTELELVGSDIQPGSNRATLILSDGKRMELSAEQQGVSVGEDGIRYLNGAPITAVNKRSNVTLSVPKAGQYQVTLADGTRVWINSDSKLDYPLYFDTDRRVVRLEGEAYFEVQSDKSKPFIVQFDGNEVEVLGTSFNIQAYPGMQDSRATLVEGSVRVRSEEQLIQVLKPNQQGVISTKEIKVRPVNVEQYILWKDGIFVWDKQEIRSIIPQLERWYDITFDLSGIPVDTPTLSGEIPRDITLQAVLAVLENQLKIKFEVRGRRVMVKN